MLTNIDSARIGDHGSELHLYWADSFDSDQWTPHPRNPVIFNSLQARNSGLIVQGGDIYRVFQVAGFDAYGASMGIAKIVELSVDHYREEFVCSIRPRFFKGLKGTHTFTFDKGVVAFDFARYEQTRNGRPRGRCRNGSNEQHRAHPSPACPRSLITKAMVSASIPGFR